MQPDTSAIPIDPCKHCGTGAPVDVHFCPRCDRILTLGRHGDYFTFLGLRRRLHLDLKDREQRFRALSRLFHPDYFHNATCTERLASLERSSYLNDAFRTLRDPMARLEYLLKLGGFTPKESHDASTKVPKGLLEEVFELNEELEAIQDMRAGGASASEIALRLGEARRPIEANLARHDDELNALMTAHDACLESGDAEGRHEGDEFMGNYLGIDVGSITTKLVVLSESDHVLAKSYIRNSGRPIEAIQQGMEEILPQLGKTVPIDGVATTGGARHLAAYLVGADLIKNEITAHAIAVIDFLPEAKTIIEIGGQDSKVIVLKNGVVVDFAMNTVCAAGTGSFLDQQAARLGISIEDFGDLALKAHHPVRIAGRERSLPRQI